MLAAAWSATIRPAAWERNFFPACRIRRVVYYVVDRGNPKTINRKETSHVPHILVAVSVIAVIRTTSTVVSDYNLRSD